MSADITIVIPSFNQGKFLDKALSSLTEQNLKIEVFVMDGGSSDESVSIIQKHSSNLAGWRSQPDGGQSSAINEGISLGSAEYVCWLNSDDWLLPHGLEKLKEFLDNNPNCPATYGKVWNYQENNKQKKPIWVEPFSEGRLAVRCIISQPGTLIRRSAWEALNGLDGSLNMAMDYDLWWRLYKEFGPLGFVDEYIAVNRDHDQTKTNSFRRNHYDEAISVVRKYHGKVPFKWWLFQPYSVWYKALKAKFCN